MRRVAAFGLLLCLNACEFSAFANGLSSAEIEGWWLAEPTYANESARIALRFVTQDGKQTLRLSLPSIAAYDIAAGNITVADNRVTTDALEFPLTYDAQTKTLSGHLPEAIVPVHKIPVTFKRGAPVDTPPARSWNYPKPAVKWKAEVGAPVWAGVERDNRSGSIFVATDAGVLHAFDPNGTLKWKFDAGQPIKARPAVIGSSVFVNSDSGFAYRLDVLTGKEQWRAKIDIGSPARLPVSNPKTRWDRYSSSFVADETQVYVASRDQHLYALDIQTGTERWRVATGDMITATPALSGETLIFGSFDGRIRSVSVRDGAQRWLYDARLPISGDIALANELVLAGSRTYDLIALDARTGKEVWKHYYWFSWIESPPVVKDGVVYTGSSDATGVFAIDLKSGKRRWKADVPGYAWPRTAVDDRLVVAGTVGQGPHPGNRQGALIGLNKQNGSAMWMLFDPPSAETVEKKRDWGFASSPVLANGVVYAADLDGTVYALKAY